MKKKLLKIQRYKDYEKSEKNNSFSVSIVEIALKDGEKYFG